jgi:hypothetical protein
MTGLAARPGLADTELRAPFAGTVAHLDLKRLKWNMTAAVSTEPR